MTLQHYYAILWFTFRYDQWKKCTLLKLESSTIYHTRTQHLQWKSHQIEMAYYEIVQTKKKIATICLINRSCLCVYCLSTEQASRRARTRCCRSFCCRRTMSMFPRSLLFAILVSSIFSVMVAYLPKKSTQTCHFIYEYLRDRIWIPVTLLVKEEDRETDEWRMKPNSSRGVNKKLYEIKQHQNHKIDTSLI